MYWHVYLRRAMTLLPSMRQLRRRDLVLIPVRDASAQLLLESVHTPSVCMQDSIEYKGEYLKS